MTIWKLDTRWIREHARKAITERLGHDAPEALLAVERDGMAVMVRVNSGGNALAVEARLRQRGYKAEQAGSNPGGYGCAVRVNLAVPGEQEGGQ